MEKEIVEEVISCSENEEEAQFDRIIGLIEDLIIGERFEKLQKTFMSKYYDQFDDKEENKLEYTVIFHEYQNEIENYLEKELQNKIPSFGMNDFIKQLMSRKTELEGEVFEILYSFSDFLEFKAMMLDFKKDREGLGAQFSEGLVVTSISKGHSFKEQN